MGFNTRPVQIVTQTLLFSFVSIVNYSSESSICQEASTSVAPRRVSLLSLISLLQWEQTKTWETQSAILTTLYPKHQSNHFSCGCQTRRYWQLCRFQERPKVAIFLWLAASLAIIPLKPVLKRGSQYIWHHCCSVSLTFRRIKKIKTLVRFQS